MTKIPRYCDQIGNYFVSSNLNYIHSQYTDWTDDCSYIRSVELCWWNNASVSVTSFKRNQLNLLTEITRNVFLNSHSFRLITSRYLTPNTVCVWASATELIRSKCPRNYLISTKVFNQLIQTTITMSLSLKAQSCYLTFLFK